MNAVCDCRSARQHAAAGGISIEMGKAVKARATKVDADGTLRCAFCDIDVTKTGAWAALVADESARIANAERKMG